MTAPKQRVAWLVLRWDGVALDVLPTKWRAQETAKRLRLYGDMTCAAPVRVTYPWPQKEAKRGK